MGLNITTPLVQHVGSGLRDKMLTDDMIITNCALDGFDKSLFIMQKVFADGVSVQLHKYAYPSCAHPTSTISAVPSAPIYCHIILNFSPRYDKSTLGNNFLALTRLLRGSGMAGFASLIRFSMLTMLLSVLTHQRYAVLTHQRYALLAHHMYSDTAC